MVPVSFKCLAKLLPRMRISVKAKAYHPGEVVSGLLTYTPTKSVKMKTGLYIMLYIEENVSWSENNGSSSNTHQARHVHSSQSMLVKDVSKNGTKIIHAGLHQWTFQFKLPLRTPPSFRSPHGRITYSLMAFVDRFKVGSEKNVRIDIDVIRPILEKMDADGKPRAYEHVDEKTKVRVWCRPNHHVFFTDDTKELSVAAQVHNPTNSKIKVRQVKLLAQGVYKAKKNQKTQIKTIGKVTYDRTIAPFDQFQDTAVIPFDSYKALYPSINRSLSHIIHIEYFLIVSCKLLKGLKGKKIKLIVPIFISGHKRHYKPIFTVPINGLDSSFAIEHQTFATLQTSDPQRKHTDSSSKYASGSVSPGVLSQSGSGLGTDSGSDSSSDSDVQIVPFDPRIEPVIDTGLSRAQSVPVKSRMLIDVGRNTDLVRSTPKETVTRTPTMNKRHHRNRSQSQVPRPTITMQQRSRPTSPRDIVRAVSTNNRQRTRAKSMRRPKRVLSNPFVDELSKTPTQQRAIGSTPQAMYSPITTKAVPDVSGTNPFDFGSTKQSKVNTSVASPGSRSLAHSRHSSTLSNPFLPILEEDTRKASFSEVGNTSPTALHNSSNSISSLSSTISASRQDIDAW
eukprot:CAMPEP_0168516232 /NCGR_PEP_ID=MMETSP0405-20121227/5279_1 /TAXON_ID=498012 /ORGANISM="Trichosphaerium sp, Strain Am-I-7 wt" /LENGTH=619 /DNA_ID=CAMNT_0008535903 /DNA_START=215 /DNA_END=2071 /DNA_ORIENTATION=+